MDRTRDVLGSLGDPQDRYSTLHVGGTNGKGTVAATLASVLLAEGHRVGLYTSPHLCAFRERIRISGEPIGRSALVAAAAEVYESIAAGGLTYFEAATVLAFHAFVREGVDVAVVEVGLGGRLDATNVITPVVSVVTQVAMDHTSYLGTSIADIAREKAGILKPGVPCVTGARHADVLRVLRRRAAAVGAPLLEVDPDAEGASDRTAAGRPRLLLPATHWGPLSLAVPWSAPHQLANVTLAVRTLECLPKGMLPSRDALLAGVAAVRWPGRFQVEALQGRTWVFDVAHNPDGARALARALRHMELPAPRVAVIGVLRDKDWRPMIRELAAVVDGVVFTEPPSAPPDRRWDAAKAASAVTLAVPLDVERALTGALDLARQRTAGGTVIVTGSHHTVGDALLALGLAPCQPG